jgi:hypothetical protein
LNRPADLKSTALFAETILMKICIRKYKIKKLPRKIPFLDKLNEIALGYFFFDAFEGSNIVF